MFDPKISRAILSNRVLQNDSSLVQDSDLFPLDFHHDTRHFACKTSPYPRLEIPQDLPKKSKSDISEATLHAYGITHAITLNGTPDAVFHHMARESLPRWQPVLDELKKT